MKKYRRDSISIPIAVGSALLFEFLCSYWLLNKERQTPIGWLPEWGIHMIKLPTTAVGDAL